MNVKKDMKDLENANQIFKNHPLWYDLRLFSYMVASILAGYTIYSYNPTFLRKFSTIPFQFCIAFFLSMSVHNFTYYDKYSWRNNMVVITIYAILLTAFLQIFRYMK